MQNRLASVIVAILSVGVHPLLAQDVAVPPAAQEPFAITDNSFLVEEALNQEPGIFQNIVSATAESGRSWEAAFTQEWPLLSRRHQISYTVPWSAVDGRSGVGDALVHYRLQVFDGTGARPAFSPRVSLIVPSGSSSRGLGNGGAGWEVNLPFSKQVRDAYFHWNAGFTHLPAARIDGGQRSLVTPRIAGSAIWRTRPMLNLMLEGVLEWPEGTGPDPAGRGRSLTVVPGLRTGWDIGETQTVVGIGVPVTRQDGESSTGVLIYFSYELPFSGR